MSSFHQSLMFAEREKWALEANELRSNLSECNRKIERQALNLRSLETEKNQLQEDNLTMKKELEDFADDLFKKLKAERKQFGK